MYVTVPPIFIYTATLHPSDSDQHTDSVSMVSVESGHSVPYQCMDASTDSTGSLQYDKSSLGDTRSDTEVLLRSKYSPGKATRSIVWV